MCPDFMDTLYLEKMLVRQATKLMTCFIARGVVKDTRLEAKDTKKIQGQGQPFRGQILSRPRTGMLEAKDKGHSRKCSQKTKF